MGTGMFDRDTLVADEWRLRSVDLIIGPAPDVETLFGALVEAVTFERILRILRREESDGSDGCGSPVDRAA